MIGKTFTAGLAAIVWLLTGAAASRAQDVVPRELQPPPGYTAAFTARATGVQIYTSTADAGSALKWTFEAPLADLRGPSGIIRHYAGPSWEAGDGSKVSRDTGTPVVSVPAKQPAADIPWLLIKVIPSGTAGVMSKVAYVQRIATAGGVAPSTPPLNVGTKVGVPYTATYVFYTKSN